MISVITPVYNGERFIESCLQVVINQDCPEIEHIIVDGGSTDGTVEIIQQYAQKYPHIRWVSERDRGQSDAMNKGIAMAKGEIIAILNVDDYYEPNVLNRVLNIFETLPEPSFLVANCNLWDDDNNLIEINKPSKMSLYDLVVGVNINPFSCNPSAYFYHASLHKTVGVYDIENHYSMDLDFILRAVQIARVKYIDQIWGNHRRIEGTKTINDMKAGNTDRRVIRLLKAYRKDLPLFQQIELAFRDVIRALKLVWQEIYTRIRYTFMYPQELPRIAKTKLLQIFGMFRQKNS